MIWCSSPIQLLLRQAIRELLCACPLPAAVKAYALEWRPSLDTRVLAGASCNLVQAFKLGIRWHRTRPIRENLVAVNIAPGTFALGAQNAVNDLN